MTRLSYTRLLTCHVGRILLTCHVGRILLTCYVGRILLTCYVGRILLTRYVGPRPTKDTALYVTFYRSNIRGRLFKKPTCIRRQFTYSSTYFYQLFIDYQCTTRMKGLSIKVFTAVKITHNNTSSRY